MKGYSMAEERFSEMDAELLAMMMRKFAHKISVHLHLNRKDSPLTKRYVSKLREILWEWKRRGLDFDLAYVKWSNGIMRLYEEGS